MITLRKLLEEQHYYRIPLKRLATGHYKLSAKINNITGDFILDTGASNSCVGFESSTHFSLKSEKSKIKAAGAGAINMETALSRKNMLLIGTKKIKNIDFVLFDLSHVNEALSQVNENPVHGIIGADLLKKQRAIIDYGRNTLYIK